MPIKNFKTRSILILIISPTGNSTLVLGISSEAKVQHGVPPVRFSALTRIMLANIREIRVANESKTHRGVR